MNQSSLSIIGWRSSLRKWFWRPRLLCLRGRSLLMWLRDDLGQCVQQSGRRLVRRWEADAP